MNKLTFDRRAFLLGAGASLLSSPSIATNADDVVFASAFKNRSGEFGLALLSENGEIIYQHSLPERGHGVAASRHSDKAIIFARRPGNFALAFDPKNRTEPHLFTTLADRHFYGHGTFSADGKLLFASENDFETGDGMIGIYDASNGFSRIGEFSSGGIGPHEITMLPDQRTLCVANGGIKTHPQYPRTKLNLDTMRSNIAFVDGLTGDMIEKHDLPNEWSRLSMRHMASDAKGKVWVGGQYEGNALDQAPLIANVSMGEPLSFTPLPRKHLNGFKNYIGSVAVNSEENLVGFTSPKGGQLLVLNIANGNVLKSHASRGVCGLASSKSGFVSSSEDGRFGDNKHGRLWDNHIGLVMK